MKKLCILGAVVAALAGLLPLAAPVATQAGDDHAAVRFFFSVVSKDDDTGHLIVLSGAGQFNGSGVEGGGGFTHYNPVGSPPFPIVAHGTWKARRFLGFQAVQGSPYGEQIAGVLRMDVELRPVGGRRVSGSMEVVCNVPQGSLFTAEDEGITLTLATLYFAP